MNAADLLPCTCSQCSACLIHPDLMTSMCHCLLVYVSKGLE